VLQILPGLPEHFLPSYTRITRLEHYSRYLAAYIFGSVARGEATEYSDLDVHIVVDEDNRCTNINHPIINGVKLDLSFISLVQLKARTYKEMEQRERIPMIAESWIVFDKTDQLAKLQEQSRSVKPKKIETEQYQFIQFMFYHGNNKVERNLNTDPTTALLSMYVGLNDFLKYHYQLQQRWWVSSKRLLPDLRSWDAPFAQLVEQFVGTDNIQAKFAYWSAIIDHILAPIGGRQPIAENNCDCEVCRQDLAMIYSDRESTHRDNKGKNNESINL
jgi:predicted nucleotidyltransferase